MERPTESLKVKDARAALEHMSRGQQHNAYQNGKLRYAISINKRLHENALEEHEEDREAAIEQFTRRDEDGRLVLRAADGRKVIRTHDGGAIYMDSAETYIQEDDYEQQVVVGGQRMSVAKKKERTLQRVFEDVEAKDEAIEEIDNREVEVKIHVVDEQLLQNHLDPQAPIDESAFMYLFAEYREMMGKGLGGFVREGMDTGDDQARMEEPEREPA